MATSGSNPRIRDSVQRVREWLNSGREKLRQQHDEGSPGIQVCTGLTELLDTVVLELFESALATLGPRASEVESQIALVPHGGYGRREMAPYSDIDLMLLHTRGSLPLVTPLAAQLVRDFTDAGVDLGFSTRTTTQACQMSIRDPVIFTSLVDSRFLGGSVRLFRQFVHAFAKTPRRRTVSLISMIEQSRRDERSKYGETVYLLEPNLKRSRGGLRDLQLLRWVGFVRYGQVNPEHLRRGGHLDPEDYRRLRRAQDFLLRVRNELHFYNNSARDVLYRSEQMRLAEVFGFQGQEGLLPVEEFMREYFRHTSTVREVVAHFVEEARWRFPRLKRFAAFMTSHLVERDFRVGQNYIAATRRGLPKVTSNLVDLLRLMDLAARYNCRIDHPTWRAIRQAMLSRDDLQVDQATAARFLSFLSQSNRLAQSLKRLHELGALEKLVPGFDHVRCLLQFNEYHKYTVDEHSIRAVDRVTDFAHAGGDVGQAYREIKKKHLLHLALLVHDLGKGYVEDHSEVGARIAVDVAKALYLDEGDTEVLRFLVHRHLMMSHLAFRRDTSDESIVIQHAAEIGSPSLLRMMFVLTCADLAAVGPDVLNQWKLEVLSEVYRRMMDHLTGGAATPDMASRLNQRRAELEQQFSDHTDRAWYKKQIERMPRAYLEGPSSGQLAEDLGRLKSLRRDDAIAWGRYLSDRQVVEYSVAVYEELTHGIFHRLTAAFASHGLEILAAEIHSLNDRLCLDRFYVADSDFRGAPPEDRFRQVSATLMRVLKEPDLPPPPARRTWQARSKVQTATLTHLPLKVRTDNTTSDAYTIIDVFTHDRPGLLYTISKTLFELGISIGHARIGTHLDQVVDVFYVTENTGQKLQSTERLEQVRERLRQAIEEFFEDRSSV